MSRPSVALLLALLAARPAAGADAPRIAAVELHGGVDPPGRLESYVATLVPVGSFYLEAGAADREGTPISTPGRLRQALGRLGYDVVVEPSPAGAGQVRLLVHLRALDRIRYIFVEGNRFLRQDEILRRISLRPGQALPLAGPERDERLELERLRVLEFLRDQGYREAEVRIEVQATKTVPAVVNLIVQIKLGPGYPIGPIVVRGNTALSSEEIAERLRRQDWRWLWTRPLPYAQSLLREDIAALTERYRALGYAGARLSWNAVVDPAARHVRVDIDVSERKRIEVAFEGNRRLSDEALRERLTLFSRGAYDDYEAEESAAAIAQHYRERGHMLVEVRWRRERVSPEADRLVFTVDEGPVLAVRGVEFVGNRLVPASTLARVVNVRPFPRLGALGLGEGGYASLRQLEVDVDNLVVHYREIGAPDAQVRCEIAPAPGRWRPLGPIRREAEADWREARALYVRFLIDEGPQVRIAAVSFETAGDEPLPHDEAFLRGSLLAGAGGPLRPSLIRQDAERLRRLLGDAGHPEASAEPAVTREGTEARIVWQLRPGPRVRVGPVFVRGNFVTREDTILEWVPLAPGDPLTTTAFERGQRNLALVQLFNNASPLAFPRLAPGDPTVPMVVEVEERHDHLGVLRVGGGVSTEQVTPGSDFPFGGYASAGYEHRNLFGRGWNFVTQGNYGNSLTRAHAAFTDPRLLGTLLRLELSGNYLSQATVRLGDIRSGGGSVGLAREMYPGVDAAVRYNLRNTFRTEFLLRGAGPDEEQTTVRIGTAVGSLSFTVDWVRLDHPLVPSRGFKLTGGVELALPALSLHNGEDTFVKAVGRSLVVVPLLPWLSLRHSVRYDHGFPFGAPVLPKVERFFAGGDTTIRGYELDRARIEVVRAPIAPGVHSVQYRPVGGSLRVLHNVDLQFPIARPLYGAVFLDSGVVSDSFLDLSPRRFRHGIGISPLLVKLPIGDISMSWAWPLDPGPGDARIGRLHFNVGLMF